MQSEPSPASGGAFEARSARASGRFQRLGPAGRARREADDLGASSVPPPDGFLRRAMFRCPACGATAAIGDDLSAHVGGRCRLDLVKPRARRVVATKAAPAVTFPLPNPSPQGGGALLEAEGPREKIEIERLLGWAYRQELPKLEITGWRFDPLTSLWELGVRVDEGGEAAFPACVYDAGNPHDDALILHEAVHELDRLSSDWELPPERLVSDLPEEVQAEAAAELARYRPQRTALVKLHARLGNRPDWTISADEVPVRRAVTWPKNGAARWFVAREVVLAQGDGLPAKAWNGPGEPPIGVRTELVEDNGTDRKGRPLKGAYRKFVLDPPLKPLIERRADRCHWWASLAWLAEELSGRLLAHKPLPPAVAAMPWETGETDPRVLPTLSPPPCGEG